MSLPGVTTGRNIVLASVQTSTRTTPEFQESDFPPEYRSNGGDLLPGDTWWDTNGVALHIWSGSEWTLVGGPGHYADLVYRIEQIENRLNNQIFVALDT